MKNILAMQNRNKALDIKLPKGTLIISPQLITHKLEFVYGKDVNEFRPERWYEKVKNGEVTLQNTEAPGLYPFGLGERNCVGRRLALLEAGLTISMLLEAHDFELAPQVSYPPKARLHGTLKPSEPVHFKFFPRRMGIVAGVANKDDKSDSFTIR